MVYVIYCILPRQRLVHVKGTELIPFDRAENTAQSEPYQSQGPLIALHLRGSASHDQSESLKRDDDSRLLLTLPQIGEHFGFEYSTRLQFLHESELRSVAYWSVDEIEGTEWSTVPHLENVKDIRLFLDEGTILYSSLSIREVGVVGGIDLGHGLFAERRLSAHSLLGEYVGVVASSASPTPYSLNYPSSTGGHEINASEVGNIIRFVNHSKCPNAVFRSVVLDGLAHVLCITIRDVEAGEQITVDYGPAYWQKHGEHVATVE